jgi:EAL domain-containing protein (putative c-di-GMP-specific phosphodiesterase class I)
LGGDQFVVQVEAVAGEQALAAMARNLLRATDEPHHIAGRDTAAVLSIGVALAGEHADDVDGLLRCADAAMRAAKAAGGARFRLYEPQMQDDHRHRLELDLRLRHALDRSEFFIVFQPIVDADGDCVVAVEALLRWADPKRGVVSPADFIPVLEQTGLIVPVGRWTLLEACRRGRRWIEQGASDLLLSVNVSPRQFAEPDFVPMVVAVLEETGLPRGHLQLEVTEGLLLDPTPQSLQKIDALVAAGVRLAVDDFGMGYSSLAYLKRFPLHALKIDRMFVRDLPRERQDAAIVRAIVDLGHGLGLHVTAEGVETPDQFHELRRLGCDSMQGYLFARPVEAAEMTQMLAHPGRVGELAAGAAPGWSTTMHALLEPV